METRLPMACWLTGVTQSSNLMYKSGVQESRKTPRTHLWLRHVHTHTGKYNTWMTYKDTESKTSYQDVKGTAHFQPSPLSKTLLQPTGSVGKDTATGSKRMRVLLTCLWTLPAPKQWGPQSPAWTAEWRQRRWRGWCWAGTHGEPPEVLWGRSALPGSAEWLLLSSPWQADSAQVSSCSKCHLVPRRHSKGSDCWLHSFTATLTFQAKTLSVCKVTACSIASVCHYIPMYTDPYMFKSMQWVYHTTKERKKKLLKWTIPT